MLKRIAALTDVPPLDLDKVKAQLHVDHCDDDELIAGYVLAAAAHVEHATGRVLVPARFALLLDDYPCGEQALPAAPVRGVEAVQWLDDAGTWQALDTGTWDWQATSAGADVWMTAHSSALPLLTRRRGGVRIVFMAGHDADNLVATEGELDLAMPAQASAAMLMLTAHFYANREAAAASLMPEIPFGVEVMCQALRIYR